MDGDRTYIISRTLIGNDLYYVARNKGGNIFARELTMEKLEKAIKAYKEPRPPVIKDKEPIAEEPKEKKYLINSLLGKVQEARRKQRASKTTPPAEEPVPAQPKEIKNELQAQVAQKRKGSKSSFWDKLK